MYVTPGSLTCYLYTLPIVGRLALLLAMEVIEGQAPRTGLRVLLQHILSVRVSPSGGSNMTRATRLMLLIGVMAAVPAAPDVDPRVDPRWKSNALSIRGGVLPVLLPETLTRGPSRFPDVLDWHQGQPGIQDICRLPLAQVSGRLLLQREVSAAELVPQGLAGSVAYCAACTATVMAVGLT
jgi:hypothetical protein